MTAGTREVRVTDTRAGFGVLDHQPLAAGAAKNRALEKMRKLAGALTI